MAEHECKLGILGISNRTENWKTARHFAPFLDHGAKRLAEHLIRKRVQSNVRLELYWKGMRDFLKTKKDKGQWKIEIGDRVRNSELFGNLREVVSGFRVAGLPGFRKLKDRNYNTSDTERLYRNLYNTEIDIVLESRHALFIGEAKGEMSLGADSRLVLVHQLIRQYVMANILVELTGTPKRVIPFVVGCNERQHQVQFMLEQGWMKKCHILQWDHIKRVAQKDWTDCPPERNC